MAPLQPFDRHQADTASLTSCGSTLVTKAAEGLTNGKLTKTAYSPALTAVAGMCAPEVQAADHAVQQGSQDVTGSLAWAAVVSRYWGSQVTGFNTEVDRITTALGNETSTHGAGGSTPGDGTTADQEAKAAWWRAYHTYIEGGQTSAAAMLRDGPTASHLQTAIDAGAMPPMTWDYATSWSGFGNDFKNGFVGIWIPPDGDWVDQGIWGGKSGMLALSWWGHGYEKIGGLQFGPRGPNGRFIKFKGTPWSYRARLSFNSKNWKTSTNAGKLATTANWAKYAKYADKGFYALSFAGGAYDQWTRDANRTDLSTGERVTRSATRGAVKLAGTYAGIETGAWAGGTIGMALGGPPGAIIGSMVGGVIGGVIGSGVADEVADYVVEAVTDPVETLEDIGGELKDVGEEIGDALKFW